jgi:hypothetical protein
MIQLSGLESGLIAMIAAFLAAAITTYFVNRLHVAEATCIERREASAALTSHQLSEIAGLLAEIKRDMVNDRKQREIGDKELYTKLEEIYTRLAKVEAKVCD